MAKTEKVDRIQGLPNLDWYVDGQRSTLHLPILPDVQNVMHQVASRAEAHDKGHHRTTSPLSDQWTGAVCLESHIYPWFGSFGLASGMQLSSHAISAE